MGERDHHNTVVTRFLQNIVVIDDEVEYISEEQPSHAETPSRRTVTNSTEGLSDASDKDHLLNAQLLVNSFIDDGLICSVAIPAKANTPNPPDDKLVDIAKQADITVLDWRIYGSHGERTMSILAKILEGDGGEKLRLIAIYTGEKDIESIRDRIIDEMNQNHYNFKPEEGSPFTLFYQHSRIVIYSKAPTLDETRHVLENNLKDRLIDDFSKMTYGLLPSIVLSSLAAVRENVHKILNQFHADLDPAYLSHRACLTSPSDSEQHIAAQLSSELYAIINDSIGTDDPTIVDRIKEWIEIMSDNNGGFVFKVGGRSETLSTDDVLDILSRGVIAWIDENSGERGKIINKGTPHKTLSLAFANNGNRRGEDIDREFAWMMNFRTIYNKPNPILHLGTVLEWHNLDKAEYFLCMRPRCDSIRMGSGLKAFLLLPLVESTPKMKGLRLVIKSSEKEFREVCINMDMTRWKMVDFESDAIHNEAVVAKCDFKDQYYFVGTINNVKYHFTWLGEMKQEFAQRVAHHLAEQLSRIAIDNSEWLRRSEK